MWQIKCRPFAPLQNVVSMQNKARRAEKTTDRGEASGANDRPTLLAAPVKLALTMEPCCRESEACERSLIVPLSSPILPI